MKPTVRAVLVISGALAIAAAVVWFLWLPDYRPHLDQGERYGVDVSNHQGEIDWVRVRRDSIAFAYIKATEGGDFVDRRFSANWEAASKAGLRTGAYHFFTLCTPGETQARNFLRVVPNDPQALPPAVDLELAGNCTDRPARATVLRELSEFLRLVEPAFGRRALLYIGDDFEDRYQVRRTSNRALWHRRFLLRPDVERWVVWQVMGWANIEGIKGDADLDVMRPVGAEPERSPG